MKHVPFAIILILMFFVWGGIAWYWYACSIKNMCETKQAMFIPLSTSN
jgi:hypothetical protein